MTEKNCRISQLSALISHLILYAHLRERRLVTTSENSLYGASLFVSIATPFESFDALVIVVTQYCHFVNDVFIIFLE